MPQKTKQRTSKWSRLNKKVSTELIHIAHVVKLIENAHPISISSTQNTRP